MLEIFLKILYDLFYSKWWRSTVAIGLIPILVRLVLAMIFRDDMAWFSVPDVTFFGLALNLSCILEMESLRQWEPYDKANWYAIHFLVMICSVLFIVSLLPESRFRVDFIPYASLVFACGSLVGSHAVFLRTLKYKTPEHNA